MKLEVGWLNFGPRYWVDGQRLYATTSRVLQALSLFSYGRRVVVDRRLKRVMIRTRSCWARVRRDSLRFDEVGHVEYRYTGFGHLECFVISLVPVGERTAMDLFAFSGEGTNEGMALPGIDDVTLFVDLHGDQEAASLGYVELLCRFLGVPLGPRFRRQGAALERGDHRRCPHCGHSIEARSRYCVYCGELLSGGQG
jgi:hypothetical protein